MRQWFIRFSEFYWIHRVSNPFRENSIASFWLASQLSWWKHWAIWSSISIGYFFHGLEFGRGTWRRKEIDRRGKKTSAGRSWATEETTGRGTDGKGRTKKERNEENFCWEDSSSSNSTVQGFYLGSLSRRRRTNRKTVSHSLRAWQQSDHWKRWTCKWVYAGLGP